MAESLSNLTRIRENPTPLIQSIHRGTQRYFQLSTAQSAEKQSKSKQIFLTILKIVSYVTVVIPFFMFVLKVSLDSFYKTVKKQKPSHKLEKKTILENLSSFIQNRTVPLIEKSALVSQPEVSNVSPIKTPTVASLMQEFSTAWNEQTKTFDFKESFDVRYFVNLLSKHAEKFKKADFDEMRHYGFIEKFDLDPAENSMIYVRADLHGDLKSLIENLRTLQQEDLLDENYKCRKGVYLVFLGDYCNRGLFGTQILELLIYLREENPGKVHLIRGNHEYAIKNAKFASRLINKNKNLKSKLDVRLIKVLCFNEGGIQGWDHLDNFNNTLPLAIYMSEEGPIREYVLYSHGLFEPSMDISALLDQKELNYLLVPKERKLSKRICEIPKDSPLAESVKRIKSVVEILNEFGITPGTAYNMGDMNDKSHIGDPSQRKLILNAEDVKHYFKLSRGKHYKVKKLLRGHQNILKHYTLNKPLQQKPFKPQSIVATTLTIGPDVPGLWGPDCAYILKTAAKVREWKKKAIKRAKGQNRTSDVTEFFPIHSQSI